MNTNQVKVLKYILQNDKISQRKIKDGVNISLGSVNKSIKFLIANNYIDTNLKPKAKTLDLIKMSRPKRAIILAAGMGIRMVPINKEYPKDLLKIKDEVLIERVIRHLREVQIEEINIVVGFLKEKYEYLIDKYNVNLIVNNNYSLYNNIYSLYLARNLIPNSYIIPCDMWFRDNPFNNIEIDSWYMVGDQEDNKKIAKPYDVNYENTGKIRVNRNNQIVMDNKKGKYVIPIGVAYVNYDLSEKIINRIEKYVEEEKLLSIYWEKALYKGDKFILRANIVTKNIPFEINTYENLRDLDKNSYNLNNQAIELIKETFGINSDEINNINILKKGMTNRSFIFTVKNKKYIMRIPGEGTEKLIDREQEAKIYEKIKKDKISDNVIYINKKNGYKITEYINNSRTLDSKSEKDLKRCIKTLKKLHKSNYQVEHYFSIYKNINFYESLWGDNKSIFNTYDETKRQIFELKDFIDKNTKIYSLCHIDANPDNFIIDKDDNIYLIDWEYAAMQDPLIDIAMFCIYAMYDREEIDRFIDMYFEKGCNHTDKIKIYSYIASCGLLWSNWCEYKRQLGVDFGEYSLRQYKYARDYYKIAKREMENNQK